MSLTHTVKSKGVINTKFKTVVIRRWEWRWGRYAIRWQPIGSFGGTGDIPFLGIDGGLKAVRLFCCLNYTYIFSHTAGIFYNVLNYKNKL